MSVLTFLPLCLRKLFLCVAFLLLQLHWLAEASEVQVWWHYSCNEERSEETGQEEKKKIQIQPSTLATSHLYEGEGEQEKA